jgi:DnaK suppressor protein
MMNKTFLLKMKEQLLAERNALLKLPAPEVDIDTDGDETDEIQGNILIQLTAQLHVRNAAKLNQIDAALKRIEDQTYGLCADCSEAIADKRLLSNPYFTTCIFCAEEREIEEKQRKKS